MGTAKELSVTDIFNELVAGNTVKLHFESYAAFKGLESALSVCKSRQLKQLESIGMDLDNSVLHYKVVDPTPDGGLEATFYMDNVRRVKKFACFVIEPDESGDAPVRTDLASDKSQG